LLVFLALGDTTMAIYLRISHTLSQIVGFPI
jgi:hypothetical protein